MLPGALQLEDSLCWRWLCAEGVIALEFLSARLGEKGLGLGSVESVLVD